MILTPPATPPQQKSRLLRLLDWGLLGLLGLLVLGFGAVYALSEQKTRRTYTVQPIAITVPTGEAAIKRGQHIAVAVAHCVDCHGENFGGSTVMDDPALIRISAPNLTTGKGGLGSQLSDGDIVRAMRHGVGTDGRSLWRASAVEEYADLSMPDLAALISYIRSLPPVDNETAPNELRLLGRLLIATGQTPLLAAEQVRHDPALAREIPPGTTLEYGHYLARVGGCAGCHGNDYTGGPIPGGKADWKPAANISPSGTVSNWSDADWVRLLRQGKRPDGTTVDAVMPWRYTAMMSDDEIKALIMYMRSVPAASR